MFCVWETTGDAEASRGGATRVRVRVKTRKVKGTADRADEVVRRGPRSLGAFELSGAPARPCEKRRIELHQMTRDDAAGLSPAFTPGAHESLGLEAALAARSGAGGTAPERVAEHGTAARASVRFSRPWAAGRWHLRLRAGTTRGALSTAPSEDEVFPLGSAQDQRLELESSCPASESRSLVDRLPLSC